MAEVWFTLTENQRHKTQRQEERTVYGPESWNAEAFEHERAAAIERVQVRAAEIVARREKARWVKRQARRGADHAERAANDANEAVAAAW